jgi:hypothetical protein
MKIIIFSLLILFSAFTYGGTATYSTADMENRIKKNTVLFVEFLNRAFISMNITSCDNQLTNGRVDSVFIDVRAKDDIGYVGNWKFKLVWKNPIQNGMHKRVEMYAAPDADRTGPVQTKIGAVFEFTCDMKTGYFVNNGAAGSAAGDLMEAYWDNSQSKPEVQARLIGPVNGDARLIQKDGVTQALASDASDISMDYTNIRQYLIDFQVDYRGPSCPTGIEIGPCEITN